MEALERSCQLEIEKCYGRVKGRKTLATTYIKHLLAEVKEALKTEISKNKEMHANGTELVKARGQRIMELERNLICLKQERRKHKTRKVGGA